ncbi:MAG: hypothetical protein HY907_07135 [Deltaproteobacteria bacterium]|nr:hypothetical protein [Deltaproteobacteria bacterium]
MRKGIGPVVALLVALGVATAAPRVAAQPLPIAPLPASAAASGFMLQAVINAGTTSGPLVMAGDFAIVSPVSGTLRIGGLFDLLAASLEVNYASISSTDEAGGVTRDSYYGQVSLGPAVQFFLWQTADGAGRFYALGAVDFGASMQSVSSGSVTVDDETFLAALKLGFGGCYFLHRNFPLGLEVGARTDFIGADNPTIFSNFFAGLTLGFVVGS